MAQRSMVSRRAILQAGAAAGAASLSGCTLLWELNQDSLEELSVSVYNYTEEGHTFEVRLRNEEDSTVFEGVFEPPPGESETQETDVTGGTEYQVLVSIAGGEVLDGTYHWGGCRVGEALIYIDSATEGNVENANTCD